MMRHGVALLLNTRSTSVAQPKHRKSGTSRGYSAAGGDVAAVAGQDLWDAFKTVVLKAERVLLYEMGFHFNVRLSSPTCPTA